METTIVKIKENEYRIDIKPFKVGHHETENIIVNGKKYSRDIYTENLFDCEENFNNNKSDIWDNGKGGYTKGDWYRIKIDEFVPFGIETFYIWSYSGWNIDPLQNIYGYHSDNNIAKLYLNLKKFIPLKNILSIHRGNQFCINSDTLNDILISRSILFNILNYHANNYISIKINLFAFLKLDFVNILDKDFLRQCEMLSDYYPKLFPKKLFEKKLTSIELNAIIIEFLNQSINLKQQKKL